MESERLYRGVFFAGSAWNFIASIPTMFLVGFLPSMIQIEAPRYPIFIYFNLMTMSMYGCIQFVVAKNLNSSRSFVKILFWAKTLTVLTFVAGVVFLDMPPSLISFLAPGIVLDLIFAALFWRYLVFSRAVKVQP